MDSARLAELLAPFLGFAKDETPGTEDLLRHISTYIDILIRWNARMNLTAIRDPEEIVTRHFGESLFAARHLFTDPGRAALQRREKDPLEDRALAPGEDQSPKTHDPSLADIGSGAGFPGIPIKLWAPRISLTLIESNHKKTTFLREVARALTLTDINIQNIRAETLPPASFDVVTLRAVESFETILPVAAHLVAPTGRLALLIGSSQLDRAIQVLNSYSWSEPLPIPHSNSRILAIAHRRT